MEITSVSSVDLLLQKTYEATNKQQHKAEQNKEAERTDPITLSAAARHALQTGNDGTGAAQPDRASGGTSGDALPLEMLAVPSWYADYGFEVSGQVGSSANQFTEKYPQAAAATPDERTEYGSLVREKYDQLMDKHGINDTASHYNATILDKNASESLRKEMADMVQSDPRLMELMSLFGKSI